MSCVSFTHAHPNDTETLLTVLSTTEVVSVYVTIIIMTELAADCSYYCSDNNWEILYFYAPCGVTHKEIHNTLY